jgi:hypothetical protein
MELEAPQIPQGLVEIASTCQKTLPMHMVTRRITTVNHAKGLGRSEGVGRGLPTRRPNVAFCHSILSFHVLSM